MQNKLKRYFKFNNIVTDFIPTMTQPMHKLKQFDGRKEIDFTDQDKKAIKSAVKAIVKSMLNEK